MDRYEVTLTGLSPLIMHADDLAFSEKVTKWQKDPANSKLSVAGDDRSPAWRWVGYLYHDKKTLGIPADNLMTMLREGGARVIHRGSKTYKKETQAGILIDQQQWPIYIGPKADTVSVAPFYELIGGNEFSDSLEAAEKHGFELLVKRAKIGNAKHVRVRPMFRTWVAQGSLTVLDAEVSGITMQVLQRILEVAGALAGLCDWRPSSPRSSGTFGRFEPQLKRMK